MCADIRSYQSMLVMVGLIPYLCSRIRRLFGRFFARHWLIDNIFICDLECGFYLAFLYGVGKSHFHGSIELSQFQITFPSIRSGEIEFQSCEFWMDCTE